MRMAQNNRSAATTIRTNGSGVRRTLLMFLGGLVGGLLLSRLLYSCPDQTAKATNLRRSSSEKTSGPTAVSSPPPPATPAAPAASLREQCGIGVDVSKLATTCSQPCPMTDSEARFAEAKQLAKSDELERAAPNSAPNPPGNGEYLPNCRPSTVLTWVVNRPEVTDVLEIGASFGGGSTAVFGRALKAKGTGEVWSLEAVPVKYKQARQYNLNAGLPAKLLLASAVAPEELPTEADLKAAGDTRPVDWLKGEVKVATLHGMGSLPHLCARHRFGLIFVDGGAFTGPAEWAAINKYCAAVPWVALDDTHAKTIEILIELNQDPNPMWEVVYEELVTTDKLYDGIGLLAKRGYDFKGGEPSLGTAPIFKAGASWWRQAGPFGLEAANYMRQHANQNEFRNFALLRNLRCDW